MTYTPPTIHAVKLYIEQHGGTVSVARSCDPNRNYYGYHLGKDQIYSHNCLDANGNNRAKGDKDYSVQTARDKSGLTDARAATDIQFFGAGGGLLKKQLQDFSVKLVARCVAKANGTSDIREIIYSPDGVKVWRYDQVSHTNSIGGGDDTHLEHTHVSYYRDTEYKDKISLYKWYFEPVVIPVPEPSPVQPDDVKALQTLLNMLGAGLVVDGVYGDKTKAALQNAGPLLTSIQNNLTKAIDKITKAKADLA